MRGQEDHRGPTWGVGARVWAAGSGDGLITQVKMLRISGAGFAGIRESYKYGKGENYSKLSSIRLQLEVLVRTHGLP